MEILERIKRFFKKDEPKMLDTGIYKFNVQKDSNTIEFREIKNIDTVKHRNGSSNSLIQAKVYKYDEENARLVEDIKYNYRYVTFEIPDNINYSFSKVNRK